MNKLKDVTHDDFKLYAGNSTYLYNEVLIDFPYKQDNHSSGAIDEFFTLRYTRLVRYFYCNECLNDSIYLVFKERNDLLRVKYVKVYTLQKSKIITVKIKPEEVELVSNESIVFLKMPSFENIGDIIIEIQFSLEKLSKESISIYIDNSKPHREFIIKTAIPEIYVFNESIKSNCLEMEETKEIVGPVIGYRFTPGKTVTSTYLKESTIFSYEMKETIKKQFNDDCLPVNCNVLSTYYNLISGCNNKNEELIPLLQLKLSDINEIK